MRYLLITLMIVLLPMRGWAGNAMAVDMAAQQVLSAQTRMASTVAMATDSAMPADCTMHTQALDDKADKTSPASAHCNSCDTCELCLALASVAQATWPAGTVSRPGAPLAAGKDHRSAFRAASYKPPIS